MQEKNTKQKEVANDSKYKIVKNIFMELEIVNFNRCNVVINKSTSYDFIFFKKLSKIKDFKVYFRVENP